MKALFIGTLDGIFKVVRANGNWKIESKQLDGAEINAVVIDPRNRQTLYVGIRGGGLCRSDDGGGSWRKFGEGVLSDKVRALTLDPSDSKTLYVGTEPPALWKSEDGGESWRE
ncbi:MAG: hypothetical protein GTO40_11355, partial [Deltaproteobacteria bacterium]|nr:hypothetical protein [Deltaproteobacteria bacterium]